MNVLIIGGSGYIGSRLCNELKNHTYRTVDLHKFGGPECLYPWDYENFLETPPYTTESQEHLEYFKSCGVIILLAGLSSVNLCKEAGLEESCYQNVGKFTQLVRKLLPHQLLIYASSASVYGRCDEEAVESQAFKPAMNSYDFSKQSLDMYAMQASREQGKRIVGLRFGTVCGYSPNQRFDLVIPSMMQSAIRNKVVRCTNRTSYRGILSLSDLCAAIQLLIDRHSKAPLQSDIYNLSSFNVKIGELAEAVMKHVEGFIPNYANIVSVDYQGDTREAYSFLLNTNKFSKHFEFEFDPRIRPVLEECERAVNKFPPEIAAKMKR